MTEPRPEDLDRLARIRERDAPVGGGGRAPRVVAGVGFAALFVAGAVWTFAPGQVRTLLGLGTSEAEKMQREAAPGPGLSTEIPRDATPMAPPPPLSTDLPMANGQEAGSGTEARLVALEAGLRAMSAREGLSRADLQTMLDANAAAIRADVNRQLLSRQPPMAAGINPGGGEAAKRVEEAQAKARAIEEAQVASRGLVIDGAAGGVPAGNASGGGRRLSGDEGFLAAAGSGGHETVRAGALADPSRTIVQGTILEGVLETALSTDLPGAIRAVLSQDVLSYDGTTTLLPKGTRLIGTYGSQVKIAQRRALVAWSRAITPEGVSVALGGIGADALGRSGQTGQVDTHFWERFGSAALISIFGLAPQVIIDDATNGDAADAIEDIGDDLRAATSGALDAYLRIAPTINVSQGDRLTIFVNRDLVF